MALLELGYVEEKKKKWNEMEYYSSRKGKGRVNHEGVK
jgi:hypothetical protein